MSSGQRSRGPISSVDSEASQRSALVTPHTFRRSYISVMVAAGYDFPYIHAQVGHRDPSTTLAIYAQVIARPDRDQLRAEIRQLLGVEPAPQARPRGRNPRSNSNYST
jgi:integrase